ncbi:MAG: hypothetical protein K2N18_02740, partial [Clostridia bacterium]|nr:hypothetical protein [Clostridia bacterium]
ADTVATVDDEEYADIVSAWNAASDAGTATVTLLADVTTDNTLTVESGKNITLDLNGHIMKFTGEVGSVITVAENGTFTLTDIRPQAGHRYNINEDGLWIFDDHNGEHVFRGGAITGGTCTDSSGSGVRIIGGKFIMNGGAISGNTAISGGGVFIDDYEYDDGDGHTLKTKGTFTMNGGTICGNCVSTLGGGVLVESGNFTMNGGTICKNVTRNFGGGVYVARDESFTMDNGEIYENRANHGGGVYCATNSELIMTGGTIRDNIAKFSSGGVYLLGTVSFEISGAPIITDNKLTDDSDNNVVLYSGKKITVTGKLEDENGKRAQIGVTYAEGEGVFTSGYGTDNLSEAPYKYFISDNAQYAVTLDGTEVKLAPIVVSVAFGEGEDKKFATVEDAFDFANNYSANAEIKLLADVTTNASIAGEDVITLDLNGHLLKSVSNGGMPFITVEHDSTLRIIDSNAKEDKKIGHDYYVNESGVWIFVDKDFENTENYEIKTLYGGVIAGSGVSNGWLSISLGTAIMEGGAICGNAGFGIVVEANGTFEMTGGRICGNQGGVRVDNGTFKVSGMPIITDNKSSDGNDENVCLQRDSKITVEGELKTGAKIGVNYEGGAGVVAVGYTQTDNTSNYFIPDGAYNCAYISNKEDGTVSIGTHDYDNAPWSTSATAHWKDCLNGCGHFMYSFSHHYEEVANDTYLKSAATCLAKAVYYKSCTDCGARGTETFEVGELADHTHGEAVRENEVAATCTAAGSYDEVIYCSVCEEELSRTAKTAPVDPDAHSFGEWTVTKEPTDIEEGEEQRVCSHDATHVETRPIAKLTPEKPAMAARDIALIVIVAILALIVLCEIVYIVYKTINKKNKKKQ